MPDQLLIAYDLGTTRLKVAAFATDGTLLALRAVRNLEHREGKRAWQDPEEWWTDAARLTRALLEAPAVQERDVLGLSLSGRGGAAVFADDDGRVVVPPWSDRRHAAQLATLNSWRREGARLSNYGAALLAKLLWLRTHEPERARGVHHVLYAKDFLLHRMTGCAVTDPTSGPDALEWDSRVLAELGVVTSVLPRVALPWTVAGPLTHQAAQALGLPSGLPVAVGGHDGICANVGAGVGAPGAYAITLGTHAVVRAIAQHHPPGAHRFYGLPPDRHVIGGNAVLAGRAADWFLDNWLAVPEEGRPAAFASMDAEAEGASLGADGVRFLPFLGGQVAPEVRPAAAAGFAGLRLHHTRAEMYRAVLEGAAFAIRAIFQQVRDWCGDPVVARFTGSGAGSAVWRQIIADALRWPVEMTDTAAESRGAAMFLAVALGLHRDVDAAAQAMVSVTERVAPDPARADLYDAVYADWRELAEALRPLEGAR